MVELHGQGVIYNKLGSLLFLQWYSLESANPECLKTHSQDGVKRYENFQISKAALKIFESYIIAVFNASSEPVYPVLQKFNLNLPQ